MMINGGKFNGRQVVAPAVIAKLAKGGDIKAFDNGPESDDVFKKGQWIYLDVNRKIAIVKVSSMRPSRDEYLDGYNLNTFYALVGYLSKM